MVNLKDLLYERRGMGEREAVGGTRRNRECKEAGSALVKSRLSPLLKTSQAIIWNCFISLTHNITCLKPQLELLEINKTPLIFSTRGKSYLWEFGRFLIKAWSQQRSLTKGPLTVQGLSVRLGGELGVGSCCWTGAHVCVQMGRRGKPLAEEHTSVQNATGNSDVGIWVEWQYFWERAAASSTVLLLSLGFLGWMHEKALSSWALHFHVWPQGHVKKTSKLWWSGRRWEIQLTSNFVEIFPLWCFAILNSIITLPEEHSKQSYFGIAFLL